MKEAAPDFRYALQRLRHLLHPPLTITAPPPGIVIERDLEVRVRDGVVLRVNVFRPQASAPCPVIMCAHPYGKDAFPAAHGPRKRYGISIQYRAMHQSMPLSHSALTTWEGPDPGFWVPRGYVVVNCDLRGFGRSDGKANLLSEEEGYDYHDLIEWAAAQPWSTGKVGLNGVSYLALSQWRAAATRPPHLAAICPWEGFSDAYRDLACPGGVAERGFFMLYGKGVKRLGRQAEDLNQVQREHPLWDTWWAEHTPDLAAIDVPALVCASFSDHCLHSGGSFRGFLDISSQHRWLYTHRGPKWAMYYAPEALRAQEKFFDWALKGMQNGMAETPPVRIEVRASHDEITSVRQEAAWPLPATRFTPLYLQADGTLRESRAGQTATRTFDCRSGRVTFTYAFDQDTELTGPMTLRLWLSLEDTDDMHIFAGVRKFRGGREVGFEGSYGFGLDMVTKGWRVASHRTLDGARSRPWLPVPTHRDPQPFRKGEVVSLDIALMPSATSFARGDVLRLDVQGRWFYIWNPLLGAFPARYSGSARGRAVLHVGGDCDAALVVPVIR